jgi:glycoprotein endo-alpha-1,2-mannosidase
MDLPISTRMWGNKSIFDRTWIVKMFCIVLLNAAAGCSPSPLTNVSPSASPEVDAQASPIVEDQVGNATPSEEASPTFPTATDLDPSYRMGVFYYPWYGTPEDYDEWVHWNQAGYTPPTGIGSDFYPVLGAYSSLDPRVIAQHFAWLRQAGVGVIICSWWGQGTREDRAIPVLLEQAERYGIKVAFHIEPYSGRTAMSLHSDIRYLYDRYGDHPAFFRTTTSSRWSPDERSKGFFFIWAIEVPDNDTAPVAADYWREALDRIHALPDGALVIANTTDTSWVDGGHFDGLYNYASLSTSAADSFNWAQGLPPDAWYVPSVLPGFSARRIGYAEDTYVDRKEGATYDNQWRAALGTGIEPAIVTITSFNEWHEGTQIEPAEPQSEASVYADYDPLPPEGYLDATREWVQVYLSQEWPEAIRARLRIQTASDWTTFSLLEGGRWIRPALVSASPEADFAWMEGDRFALLQPLPRAEAGQTVEMVVDLELAGLNPDDTLTFEIERGHIGWTKVELMRFEGDEPLVVDTLKWFGISGGERNARLFNLSADPFLETSQP